MLVAVLVLATAARAAASDPVSFCASSTTIWPVALSAT